MATAETPRTSWSQFACIGTGFSAICLGATLKRWYGNGDIQFFERHSQLGGTWFTNRYPGCACDIPGILYSYSFELRSNWSRILPQHDELWTYLKDVADKYDLSRKMSFGMDVERCEWDEQLKRWRLTARHLQTGTVSVHECQFLFAGTGILVQPQKLDVPGIETFQGQLFHSSRWPQDLNIAGKRVVVVGNGCTANQLVPSIVGEAKHVTQIVRSKQWIYPPVEEVESDAMGLMCKYVPGATRLLRFALYSVLEKQLKIFPMTNSAAKSRQRERKFSERYMRKTAPAKYHDILIPDFEVGCKRRIIDSGYLASLHSENITLTNERPVEILPGGIQTEDGFIAADIIVLANGFVTNNFVAGVDTIGRDGTLTDHWATFGGAAAYNGSAMSGFPNFFILLGPNLATGHTSAIMAVENSVNFALRLIRPVISQPTGWVELKLEAEKDYVERMQHDLSNTVWNSGCQSWYIESGKNKGQTWNAMTYPYSQAYFWYRCLFPTWSDWNFSGTGSPTKKRFAYTLLLASVVSAAVAIGVRGDFITVLVGLKQTVLGYMKFV